ncbi:efflux transporter outer membrane subunit [Paralcaligenes sp. KSB-10]|uniref:efflux transporter outer membrane subunit n=1 Tax=Paralcaligenes sp. KSB-10 TaxID=2901142 RepID=UPI001E606BFE|nr:efflux transporter outer membrane subunit [Paralcaligenes sp. KSB-10]UHL65420.1 efflux transporter outer membrane subunit [Paralcaligenes sp. KSB-10]
MLLPLLLLQGAPRRTTGAACLAMAVLLAGCAVGPDYVRPSMEVPAAYKEAGPWKTAQPRQIDSGHNWWQAYGDLTLDHLIEQANQTNQNIRQAEAQYRQALAVAAEARAGFWPTLGIGGGAGRAQTNTNGPKLGNNYTVGVTAGWEPDLWGGIRRSAEAGQAASQASAADLAAARLSIQTTLAQDYMQLRVTDLQLDLYARTLKAYQRALTLTQNQYAAGVTLRSDVALAQSQLSTAQAQALDLQAQRSQLEHALAILTGKAPAAFSLPPVPSNSEQTLSLPMQLPAIPTGLPSDLLERRPDIASAERRAAAANANIGVARAAYFPSLMLSASGGFDSGSFLQWFNVPGRVWALGASLAQTVFDGGLRKARDQQATAAYDAAVAQYKQTVLGGFQEVEDNLATLRILAQEAVAQDQAVQSARLAANLALAQYRAGTSIYLNVVTAQALALSAERTMAQLRGRQLLASVALIKATGGGWSASQLPAGPSETASRAKSN